ncbi:MAG: DNA internalization-related competence protein ComEC/Rec2 [Clostridia bacterium]|nr:DNA internalization-related competence protein ComEC/Rec2 [Clostridia bacterium]
MSRPLLVIFFFLVLITILLINQNYWMAIAIIMFLMLTIKGQQKYVFLVILLILVMSFFIRKSIFEQVLNPGNYQGELHAYKSNYYMTFNQKKVFIRNDTDRRLPAGKYKVSWDKTSYEHRNPNTFSYRDYLNSLGFIQNLNLSEIKLIPIEVKYTLFQKLYIHIENEIKSTYSDDYSGYIKGLFLGDTSKIDSDMKKIFQENGVSHVFAISGLHIGAFIGALLLILKKFEYKQVMTYIIITFYVILVGVPYSALRALMMFLCVDLALKVNRPYDLLSSLSGVGIVVMLINPYAILHTGFQFSFIALLCIGTLLPYLKQLKSEIWLPLGIQLMLLPLVIYHQNTFHILSFVINLITVPLITVVFYMMFIPILFPLPFMSTLVELIIGFVEKFNYFMHQNIFLKTVCSPSLYQIVFFYFIIICWFEIKNKMKILGIVILFASMVVIYKWYAIEIYFLDVNQGDAILIEHRFKNMMIDTGPEYPLIEDILKKNGISKLDYIFISHEHSDHVGGLTFLEPFINDTLFLGQFPNAYLKLIHGQEMKTIEDIGELEIKPIFYDDVGIGNNASLVLLLEAYERKLLFTGDIEEEVEKQLNNLHQIDVLKIPHHGSDSSSTQNFIDMLNPRIGVICVNKNYYGHPDSDVIRRYQRLGTKLYLTQDGCVKITILPFSLMFVKTY